MFEHLHNPIIVSAMAAAPKELCGVIHDNQFVALENVHPEPETHFRMADADAARYMGSPKTQAIVHSHTSSPACGPCPSKVDQIQQEAMGLPWVIAGFNQHIGKWSVIEMGDHNLERPILGQKFVYGVTDCYQLVRRWYWQQKGVKLPAIHSDYGWWIDGSENLYVDNYERGGFKRIERPDTPRGLQPGDCFLYPLQGSPVYNHVGLYAGDGLVFQHTQDTDSKDYVIGPWFRRTTFWLRWAGD